jgi:hypothetical protein
MSSNGHNGGGHGGHEDIVSELVNALDQQTEPYAAWKESKGAIQKGVTATTGKADYFEETFGPKLTDKIEGFAVDFYGGKEQDKKMFAHIIRQDLGENYGEFRESIKRGDVVTANKMVRDVSENKVYGAGLEQTIEKLSSLSPDERIDAGKKLAHMIGGDDYVAAATNPGQLAGNLRGQKRIAEAYKTPTSNGGGGHH